MKGVDYATNTQTSKNRWGKIKYSLTRLAISGYLAQFNLAAMKLLIDFVRIVGIIFVQSAQ